MALTIFCPCQMRNRPICMLKILPCKVNGFAFDCIRQLFSYSLGLAAVPPSLGYRATPMAVAVDKKGLRCSKH